MELKQYSIVLVNLDLAIGSEIKKQGIAQSFHPTK
jgi:mRNA-degrading endonuclease toxin of MazEF toxin-antitoxin module